MIAALMADNAHDISNEPWPSLETASWLFDRASFVLVGSLLFGLAATVAIVWMGIVKEHHWDLARERANEKIAAVNEETARLSLEAESARKETAQAKIELQQLRFARRLDNQKLKADISGMPSQFFEVLFDQSAADGSGLAFQIFVALASMGWRTDQKLPAPLTPQLGPPELREVYQLLPLTQQAGASPWGVSVVTKGPITDDPAAPEQILLMALLKAVDSPVQTVGGGKDQMMPEGKIRIVVGPKLP